MSEALSPVQNWQVVHRQAVPPAASIGIAGAAELKRGVPTPGGLARRGRW